MRITGGVLTGWSLGSGFAGHVRPTTDRVRESILNTIRHQKGIEGFEILDLFSGSGIMSMEFLSYGAQRVVSVDRDFRNITFQKKSQKLHEIFNSWEIYKRDVYTFLGGNRDMFDIIFADPPYDLPNLHGFPTLALSHLKPGGWLVFEHQPQLVLTLAPDVKKEYGSTTISIFEKKLHYDS
jgi:16S rRNA (guanine966-N2)-methyltransferase